MKKKIQMSVVLLMLTMPILAATDMYVKKKNGEIVTFDVEEVEEVYYKKRSNPDDSNVADASDLPLKFKILSNSSVEVTKDFSYCDLETVTIPEKVRINGDVYTVSQIGDWAFAGFSNLTKIEIPSSVTTIGESAFRECENLYVVVDNIEANIKIGNEAFYGCKSVKYNK